MTAGKKGLALDLKAFKILAKHAAALTAQLGDHAVPADEVKPIVAAKPTPQKSAAANKAAAANDGPSGSPSGLSPGGGSGAVAKQETGVGSSGVSGGGSSGKEFRADLGAMKRVSVSIYQGAVNVGIREFYQVCLRASACICVPAAWWSGHASPCHCCGMVVAGCAGNDTKQHACQAIQDCR